MERDADPGSPGDGQGAAPQGARPALPTEPDPALQDVAPLARLRLARLSEAHSMLLVHALKHEQDVPDEEE